MKYFWIFVIGIIIGSWVSWPGILTPNNWKCFNDIISKSDNQKISLKALLAVSPNYLLKVKKRNIFSKIRIVGDACFR
jgi:hypothetical protein